jgi:hypothetical protein
LRGKKEPMDQIGDGFQIVEPFFALAHPQTEFLL